MAWYKRQIPSGGSEYGAAATLTVDGVDINSDTLAVNDLTASAAELNLLDGAGEVVASGTPVTHITDAPDDASEAHALNSTFSDTEVEGALDALGAKLNAVAAQVNLIIDALEAFRIDPGA